MEWPSWLRKAIQDQDGPATPGRAHALQPPAPRARPPNRTSTNAAPSTATQAATIGQLGGTDSGTCDRRPAGYAKSHRTSPADEGSANPLIHLQVFQVVDSDRDSNPGAHPSPTAHSEGHVAHRDSSHTRTNSMDLYCDSLSLFVRRLAASADPSRPSGTAPSSSDSSCTTAAFTMTLGSSSARVTSIGGPSDGRRAKTGTGHSARVQPGDRPMIGHNSRRISRCPNSRTMTASPAWSWRSSSISGTRSRFGPKKYPSSTPVRRGCIRAITPTPYPSSWRGTANQSPST